MKFIVYIIQKTVLDFNQINLGILEILGSDITFKEE